MRASLVDALLTQVQRTPHRTCLIFLHPDDSQEQISYEQLHHDALHYATLLRERNVQSGELVFLLFEHSYELVASFWGAIYAGAVPSIFPYYNPRVSMAAFEQRIARRVAATEAAALVTPPESATAFAALLADSPCRVMGLAGEPSDAVAQPPISSRAGEDSAYIQFSSGTTGVPKGSIVSHRAALHHVRALADHFSFGELSLNVAWLPLYHDMGLITEVLLPLLTGGCSVTISPTHWVRRPATLLRAIHEYGGTMSWMPNFAFNHCTRYIRDEEIAGCDLGSWRILGNGSEPVQWESLQAFATRFAPYNFRADALMVGYGMAENVVAASLTPLLTEPRREWVTIEGESDSLQARAVHAATPGATSIVSCGRPIQGTTLAIVDAAGQPLPERHIGEVVLKGSSRFTGYYRQPALTAQALRDGWYHTGDVGYLAEGELFLYERKADIIIVGGHNVRPYDIEQIAQTVLEEYKGEAVAFGLRDQKLGTELPIVVCETRGRVSDTQRQAFAKQIRQRVLQQLDVTLGDVYLVRRGWVVKTTSGKLARAANQQKYIEERKIYEHVTLPHQPES